MEDTMDMVMIMDMVDLTQSLPELHTATTEVLVMTPMSNTHLPTTTTTPHLMVIQSMGMVMEVMDTTKISFYKLDIFYSKNHGVL